MRFKDLKNRKWCKCKERKEGHSAGTLLDGTDLITCNKCGYIVLINGKKQEEIRLEEQKKVIKKLLKWTPEVKGLLKQVSNIHYGDYGMEAYQKGDEDCPFISEAYLYNLLGKEDARTFLALLNKLFKVFGYDLDELMEECML